MNVGELLRERDRLLGVMEEAKTARVKLRQVNVLIALYGDAANVEFVSNGHSELVTCPECGKQCRPGVGLGIHRQKAHGVAGTARAKKVAKKAKRAAKR